MVKSKLRRVIGLMLAAILGIEHAALAFSGGNAGPSEFTNIETISSWLHVTDSDEGIHIQVRDVRALEETPLKDLEAYLSTVFSELEKIEPLKNRKFITLEGPTYKIALPLAGLSGGGSEDDPLWKKILSGLWRGAMEAAKSLEINVSSIASALAGYAASGPFLLARLVAMTLKLLGVYSLGELALDGIQAYREGDYVYMAERAGELLAIGIASALGQKIGHNFGRKHQRYRKKQASYKKTQQDDEKKPRNKKKKRDDGDDEVIIVSNGSGRGTPPSSGGPRGGQGGSGSAGGSRHPLSEESGVVVLQETPRIGFTNEPASVRAEGENVLSGVAAAIESVPLVYDARGRSVGAWRDFQGWKEGLQGTSSQTEAMFLRTADILKNPAEVDIYDGSTLAFLKSVAAAPGSRFPQSVVSELPVIERIYGSSIRSRDALARLQISVLPVASQDLDEDIKNYGSPAQRAYWDHYHCLQKFRSGEIIPFQCLQVLRALKELCEDDAEPSKKPPADLCARIAALVETHGPESERRGNDMQDRLWQMISAEIDKKLSQNAAIHEVTLRIDGVSFTLVLSQNTFSLSHKLPNELRMTADDMFFVVRGVINDAGQLEFDLTTRTRLSRRTYYRSEWLRGHRAIVEIIKYFEKIRGEKIESVKAVWQRNWDAPGELSDNFDQFMFLLAQGASRTEAARGTWTGKQLTQAGFTNIEEAPRPGDKLFAWRRSLEEHIFVFTRP